MKNLQVINQRDLDQEKLVWSLTEQERNAQAEYENALKSLQAVGEHKKKIADLEQGDRKVSILDEAFAFTTLQKSELLALLTLNGTFIKHFS